MRPANELRPARDGDYGTDAAMEFATLFADARPLDLTPPDLRAVKGFIADCVGVAAAGSRAPGLAEMRDLGRAWGGSPEATVFVTGERLPSPMAALVNSAMARALDYDDVFEHAINHTSCSVVPTALAMAETTERASGKEFLDAVVLGRDLICRMSLANRNLSRERPRSQSYPFNAFAAAAVAGRYLQLSATEILHAIGLTYGQAISNRQGVIEGTISVRIHQGMASQIGVVAAELAARGITGPTMVFEGEYGYYAAYEHGEYDRAELLREHGTSFRGMDGSIKPFPVCKQSHTAVQAALDYHAARGGDVSRVRSVHVGLNADAFHTVCGRTHGRYAPTSAMDVQFSGPWVVGLALANGSVSLEDLEPASYQDPEVLRLVERIDCGVDPDIEARSSGRMSPAVLTVREQDGSQWRTVVDVVKGHPSNPLTADELEAKFHDCCSRALVPLSRPQAEKAFDLLMHLEEVEDIRELLRCLVAT